MGTDHVAYRPKTSKGEIGTLFWTKTQEALRAQSYAIIDDLLAVRLSNYSFATVLLCADKIKVGMNNSHAL